MKSVFFHRFLDLFSGRWLRVTIRNVWNWQMEFSVAPSFHVRIEPILSFFDCRDPKFLMANFRWSSHCNTTIVLKSCVSKGRESQNCGWWQNSLGYRSLYYIFIARNSSGDWRWSILSSLFWRIYFTIINMFLSAFDNRSLFVPTLPIPELSILWRPVATGRYSSYAE